MQSVTIGENEAGQRLDKFLGKYLKLAPKSFLYKMLRKKNITVNRKILHMAVYFLLFPQLSSRVLSIFSPYKNFPKPMK